MKTSVSIFLLLLFSFVSCQKSKERYFTIIATKTDTTSEAILSIEGDQYSFTGKNFQTQKFIGEYDVKLIKLSKSGAYLTLAIEEDGNELDHVYGTGYVSFILNNDGVYSKSGSTSTGIGSSTGSNCTTVQCSESTQAGSHCKRMTTNCNGRCWQHQ